MAPAIQLRDPPPRSAWSWGGESSWIVRHGTQGNPEEHVQLVVIDYGHPLRVQEARNLA